MIVLILPFQFGCFLLFSCLIALARTSNTMLNKSGESGHPCPVLDLRGKTSSFSPLNMKIHGLYYIEVRSLYTHSVKSYYHKWMLNFVKCFFCFYWNDHMIFVLRVVTVVFHKDWFADVEPSLQSWNKSHLIMVYDPLNILLHSMCYYFVENFYIYVHQEYWPIIFFLWCPCLVLVRR